MIYNRSNKIRQSTLVVKANEPPIKCRRCTYCHTWWCKGNPVGQTCALKDHRHRGNIIDMKPACTVYDHAKFLLEYL